MLVFVEWNSLADAPLQVLCLGENEITRIENMSHLSLLCSLDLSDNQIEVRTSALNNTLKRLVLTGRPIFRRWGMILR